MARFVIHFIKELKAGERIQIEAGHLLAFDGNMSYGISRVEGIKSMLFFTKACSSSK